MDLLYTHRPACFIRGPSGSHLEFISSSLKFERDKPPAPLLCKPFLNIRLNPSFVLKQRLYCSALRCIAGGSGVTNLLWTSHILISPPQQVTARRDKCFVPQRENAVCRAGARLTIQELERFVPLIVFFYAHESAFGACIIPRRGFPNWWAG